MYEAYRPRSAQTRIFNAITEFSNENPHIRANLSGGRWNISWFVASGISNHQRGFAVDVGLARVISYDYTRTGDYHYMQIIQAEYYEMPTPIGELSINSIVYRNPVTINSFDAWRTAEYSESMQNNIPAQNLQKYFTAAGFTPLASEWWHFNDLYTMNRNARQSNGNFEIKDCFSIAPE
jgi:D-alanyl-D-alanine dipeptidase